MGSPFSSFRHRRRLSHSIRHGDLPSLRRIHPSFLLHPVKPPFLLSFFSRRFSPLQIAAFHGQLHVLDYLLELGADPNERTAVDGQTPLMLACKRGNAECVRRLLQKGGDVLAFDKVKGRTCLHMASRGGHVECVEMILEAAKNTQIATTWGFERFVNVRDDDGAIPLHMAARAGNVDIVKLLLTNGALVIAVTCKSTYGPGHGSTPLHCAARSGSLACVEELLAWGADRTYKDMMGETAYDVAAKRGGDAACAAILDPAAAEPLVWPSPLPLVRNMEPTTRHLLHKALLRSNRKRRLQNHHPPPAPPSPRPPPCCRFIPTFFFSKPPLICHISDNLPPSPTNTNPDLHHSSSSDCMICFEISPHMIILHPCSHFLCPSCAIAICCHCKPDPTSSPTATLRPSAPSCPFCRRGIAQLSVQEAPASPPPLIHD